MKMSLSISIGIKENKMKHNITIWADEEDMVKIKDKFYKKEYSGLYCVPYFDEREELRWKVKSWDYIDNTYLTWYGQILLEMYKIKINIYDKHHEGK